MLKIFIKSYEIFLFLSLILSVTIRGQRPFRTPCELANGLTGFCRPLDTCGGHLGRFPTFCRNSRVGPIVCCPPRWTWESYGHNYRPGPGYGGRPGFQNDPSIPPPRWSVNRFNRNRFWAKRKESISKAVCREIYFPDQKILQGSTASGNEFPFMAALGWETAPGSNKFSYNCGGFLIADNFVLTAAHCASLNGKSPNVAKVGGESLHNSTVGKQVTISGIITHPSYKPNQFYNDIALIQLTESVPYTPACLWFRNRILSPESTAIGYGSTSFAGPKTNNLQRVQLQLISNDDCCIYYPPNEQLPKGLENTQICAGDPNRKMDTCQGDSGGPLIIHRSQNGKVVPYIVGITSFGHGCAGQAPSIYTRMTSFVHWIEAIVWPEER